MEIISDIVSNSDCYRNKSYINVKGLMLHSVGCNQPNSSVFISQWNKPYITVCPHAVIDGITGNTHQLLPWKMMGWHAGGTANRTHIGVEMCEPKGIKYDRYHRPFIIDAEEAYNVVQKTYASAVELFAHLCEEFNLDPLAEGVIISHSEGYQLYCASNHADPEHLWKALKLPYTMDKFRNDVSKRIAKNSAFNYSITVRGLSSIVEAKKVHTILNASGYSDVIITNERS